ncbi:class I adenylate-forming enzyme family protein [Pseudarthrobacter sp. J1738]|uniref:class I adenylate-forming enzyme family protein n=1 Tax=Pseudarthrobacter sp. J1738 TaxID=3420446 RepID=UPI003D28CE4D
MPFLNRLRRWSQERASAPAVAIGDSRWSWEQLVEQATLRLSSEPLTILESENSLDFVARWVAGVAGSGVCAVLDPKSPATVTEQIRVKLSEVRDSADGSSPGNPPTGTFEDGPAGSPFLIGLTSGTASVPKGFLRSRGSWQASFDSSINFFGLRDSDRTLAPGPLYSSLNLYALSECLYAGSPFFGLDVFDVGEAHASIVYDGITRLVVAPTPLRLLSERGIQGSVDASSLRTIVCAGAKLDARTLDAARRWAPNADIFEYYGAAELSFVSGTRTPAGPAGDGPAPASLLGEPFPGVELRIQDDDGTPVPPGTEGSIAVRSPMISGGYLWGDDGRAFRRNGDWATVGDKGYIGEDGLHFLGRSSDMMNSAGRNVYPQEVEVALCSLSGVEAAVVTSVKDEMRGERIIAAIVPSHGAVSAAQLRLGLDSVLDKTKQPLQFYSLSTLPLTDRGKVSRAILREWVASHSPFLRLML